MTDQFLCSFYIEQTAVDQLIFNYIACYIVHYYTMIMRNDNFVSIEFELY